MNRGSTILSTLTISFVIFCSAISEASILNNESFEAVPGPAYSQGILPSDYATAAGPFIVGADTYSNDGSYGLFPSDFGNFPGVSAEDGIRFVAAADFGGGVREAFGQLLSVPLTPNALYRFSGFVQESPRLGNGGYELLLSPSISMFDAGIVSVGLIGPTTTESGWELRTLDFTAPVNANQLSYIIFSPYSSSPNGAYIGLDNLSLTVVPEMPSWGLIGIVCVPAMLFIARRRRQTCTSCDLKSN